VPKKKTGLVVASVFAALAMGFFVWRGWGPKEPAYGGHRLNYWVGILGRPEQQLEYQQATNAIDHIGVAALPFLVEWVHCETPTWRMFVGSVLYRIQTQWSGLLWERVMRSKKEQIADGTPVAFRVLGPRALPALDDLQRLMDSDDPRTALVAISGLTTFGTNALPALLSVATNAHHSARWQAFDALGDVGELGIAAPVVFEVVTNCLSDTNEPTGQQLAVMVLGKLKIAPEISVPALLPFLSHPNPNFRTSSAGALGSFGSNAVVAIPALTNALADPDPQVRSWAAGALRNIAP